MARRPDPQARNGSAEVRRQREQAAAREMLDYKSPIYLTLMRNGLLSVVGIVVLLVLYSVYWFVVATNLKDSIKPWVEERAGTGVQASFERIEISGYPMAFRVILTKPRLAASFFSASSAGEGWRWEASRVIAEMKPWDFNAFRVDLSGSHEVVIEAGLVREHYRGAARDALVDAILSEDGLPQVATITARGLDVRDRRRNERLSVKDVRIHGLRRFPEEVTSKTPTFDLDVAFKNLNLPKRYSLPLGPEVKLFDTRLQVLGEIKEPFDSAALVSSLTAWRDGGGIIEFEALEARYGPLFMQATGTLALDIDLQPLAAMSARFQGFFPAIERLKAARVIRSRDAALAKVVLGVLSRRTPGSDLATVSLPLNIQNGVLTAQQVKLMDISPIVWPDPKDQS